MDAANNSKLYQDKTEILLIQYKYKASFQLSTLRIGEAEIDT